MVTDLLTREQATALQNATGCEYELVSDDDEASTVAAVVAAFSSEWWESDSAEECRWQLQTSTPVSAKCNHRREHTPPAYRLQP